MSTEYLGSLSVGALSLGVNLALPQLVLRINMLGAKLLELTAKIASITAQLDLIADVKIPNPLTLTTGLTAALGAVAQIAVQFPAATVNIGASLQADIDATIALAAAIQLELDAILELKAQIDLALSGGGIAAYSYAGPANAFGGELSGALVNGLPGGTPEQAINGLVLACSSPADWGKLGVVLKVA